MSTNVEEKLKLGRRQLKAIPFLVSSPTYTQGCEKTKINKATLYKWLKNPEFKAELDRQRNEIVEAAFGMIAQNIEEAVSELTGLSGCCMLFRWLFSFFLSGLTLGNYEVQMR
jgi:hypothetical protein